MSYQSPGDTQGPDYIPGGVSGFQYSLEDGKCCADRTCQCLGGALDSIAASTALIASHLENLLVDPCDKIESCMDKIVDGIKQRLDSSALPCDECKRMAAAGLAGSLDYAIRCAGSCLDQTAKECSLGDESTWGKPCQGCGEKCCTCKAGNCLPTPCETDDSDKPFIGYCSRISGNILVLRAGNPPPSAEWQQVAIAETEQAASIAAVANCNSDTGPIAQFPEQPKINPVVWGPQGCNIADYTSGEILRRIQGANTATNLAAGVAQATNAVLSFGFEGINLGKLTDVIIGVNRSQVGGPSHAAALLLPIVTAAVGCDDTQVNNALMAQANLGVIAKLTGIDISKYSPAFDYAILSKCRQKQMDPDKAIAAYLANSIDLEKLDQHWAIAGLCPPALQAYLKAARAKPVPIELANMRFRKLIDESKYNASMRELGYLEQSTVDNLFELRKQIPTLADIIRLMVRDADDNELAARLGLDDQFDQKYGKQLREWSEFQGIPEQVARYTWRAHWTIPSPGQLFNFYHRLRDNPAYGGREKILSDIKSALVQQDILPYWHQHFLDTSFLPIGRVDIRRAYNIGALTDKELIPSYLQLGYSDETAETLAKFTRRLRDAAVIGSRPVKLWVKQSINRAQAVARLQSDGLPDAVIDKALSDAEALFISSPAALSLVKGDITVADFRGTMAGQGVSDAGIDQLLSVISYKITTSPALKEYAVGLLSPADAKQRMVASGMSTQTADKAIDDVDRELRVTFMASCQRGIKRRYLMGELDSTEARNELIKRAIVPSYINKLLDNWDCERSSIGRPQAANKLCDWLARGVITATEFTKRLTRMGYTANDAAIMTDDCLVAISASRLKQAQKEIKDQAALNQRAARALEKQAARERTEANRLKQMSDKAAAVKKARRKQLYAAVNKVAKKCDCELEAVMTLLEETHKAIQRDYGLTVDQSLQVLLQSAERWGGGQPEGYLATVAVFASEFDDSQLTDAMDAPTTNNADTQT